MSDASSPDSATLPPSISLPLLSSSSSSSFVSNKTLKKVFLIHGKDPQHLIEKIIRERIYSSLFWREKCVFSPSSDVNSNSNSAIITANLNILSLANRHLDHIGGVYGGSLKATPFICLLLKMLQLGIDNEWVIDNLISNQNIGSNNSDHDDFIDKNVNNHTANSQKIKIGGNKYIRALGLFYLRLTGVPSSRVYKILEPHLEDYSKLRIRLNDGTYSLITMDQWIEELLWQDRSLGIILPRLVKRIVLEDSGELSEGRLSAFVL